MSPSIRPQFRHYLAKKFIKANLPNNARFADIGAGRGDFSFWLGSRGYHIDAFEFSEKSVSAFRNEQIKHPNYPITLHATDFFSAENQISFDAIVIFEVLEHLKDDVGAVKKIHDWLKPNGYIIASVPAHKKMWGKDDEIYGHVRRYERDELKNLFENNGFSILTFTSYGFPWLNILKKVREFQVKIRPPQFSHESEDSLETGTKNSGVGFFKSKILGFIFNPFTFYPLILISILFHSFDVGEGYFVIAKKNKI